MSTLGRRVTAVAVLALVAASASFPVVAFALAPPVTSPGAAPGAPGAPPPPVPAAPHGPSAPPGMGPGGGPGGAGGPGSGAVRPDHPIRRTPPPGATRPGSQPQPVQAMAPPPPSHEAAEHEEEGPKPVNWTDFGNKEQPPYLAALLNFAVLAIIYVGFGRKPIAAALKARREEVSKQIEDAQKIKHEAEARSAQYASKLKDLDTELTTTKQTLAAAGAGEKARIVREAEEKAVRMEKDAQFLLEQERKQLQLDLQREAVQAGLLAAEQVLRTKLTMADQERVAEEFLATLIPDAGLGALKNALKAGGAT